MSTMAMSVDAICAFLWIRICVASRYISPIMTHFDGRLMHMDAIMWGITRRRKPYKYGCSVSSKTWLFTHSHDGPGKKKLWVTLLFLFRPPPPPFSLTENFSATPSGTTFALLIWGKIQCQGVDPNRAPPPSHNFFQICAIEIRLSWFVISAYDHIG